MEAPLLLRRIEQPVVGSSKIATVPHGIGRFATVLPSLTGESRVFLLLSTFNGATFLPAQLDSLIAQTHVNWVLYWRDDGSSDGTPDILSDFTARVGEARCVEVQAPRHRIYPAASYLAMIRAVLPKLGPADTIAFVDQDDCWLPGKLRRGVIALTQQDRARPMLYCARLSVVDSNLRSLTETRISAARCGFPASLSQNIATGCTIMLNRPAAMLVARSAPPASSMHDWWCYLVVTAAGGRVLVDDAVVALYRQHTRNVVGAPTSRMRRAIAALRRGPAAFMNMLRQHVSALLEQPDLMSESTRSVATAVQRALNGGVLARWAVLRTPGFKRQTWSEDVLFRLWFLIG